MGLQWDPNLSVGVEQIDKQHKELIGAVNNMLDACKNSRGKDEAIKTFAFMERDTRTHFADEERLQQKYQYPDAVRHKELHQQFIETMGTLRQDLDASGVTLSFVGKLNHVLVEWIIKHINNEDKKIGAYLKSNSIKA